VRSDLLVEFIDVRSLEGDCCVSRDAGEHVFGLVRAALEAYPSGLVEVDFRGVRIFSADFFGGVHVLTECFDNELLNARLRFPNLRADGAHVFQHVINHLLNRGPLDRLLRTSEVSS
jgi:hypothetical protein